MGTWYGTRNKGCWKQQQTNRAVAILSCILYAGNDLARALKWGGGYTGEKVMQILLSLEDANVVYLDRCV